MEIEKFLPGDVKEFAPFISICCFVGRLVNVILDYTIRSGSDWAVDELEDLVLNVSLPVEEAHLGTSGETHQRPPCDDTGTSRKAMLVVSAAPFVTNMSSDLQVPSDNILQHRALSTGL